MPKPERITRILLRLGHITPVDIEGALTRQEELGGLIGRHLVESGALTEEQLFEGLVEQFHVPTITVRQTEIDEELLDRMPKITLQESLILPLAWDEPRGVLTLAVANPSDREAIEQVRAAFGAGKVRVSLAPEAVLADLVLGRTLEGQEAESEGVRLVALPELYDPEDEETSTSAPAEPGQDPLGPRVLLVGGERVSEIIAPALRGAGCVVVIAADLGSAQTAVVGNRPEAIVVDHAELGHQTPRACRVLGVDRGALLYVLTDETRSETVLELLGLGVDDVIGPPHDAEVTLARIRRAIDARAASRPTDGAPDGLAGTFAEFSFVDLTQVVANDLRSVRVEVKNSSGEEGVVFFEQGRPFHAACGALTGEQAVYYMVSWEDEGGFSVHDNSELPEPNVSDPIEALLMEGTRLLEERQA